eukprot:COSAG06_NODE_4325_length_4365_cov_2.112518_4_plen_63_part_00
MCVLHKRTGIRDSAAHDDVGLVKCLNTETSVAERRIREPVACEFNSNIHRFFFTFSVIQTEP